MSIEKFKEFQASDFVLNLLNSNGKVNVKLLEYSFLSSFTKWEKITWYK